MVEDLDLNVDNGFVDDGKSSLPRVQVIAGNALACEGSHKEAAEFLFNRELKLKDQLVFNI